MDSNRKKNLKSGNEVLKDFLECINSLPNVDSEICTQLLNLHNEGKFSNSYIIQALDELREAKLKNATK